jgi:hypothetical protein
VTPAADAAPSREKADWLDSYVTSPAAKPGAEYVSRIAPVALVVSMDGTVHDASARMPSKLLALEGNDRRVGRWSDQIFARHTHAEEVHGRAAIVESCGRGRLRTR